MFFTKHFLYALIIPIIMLFFYPWQYALIFILATVLIDVDHYLYYIFRKKDINPIKYLKFYDYIEKKYNIKEYKGPKYYFLCILHTYEFYILMFILSFIHIYFLIAFLAIVFHIILDIIDMKIRIKNMLKSYSLLYYLFMKENPNERKF